METTDTIPIEESDKRPKKSNKPLSQSDVDREEFYQRINEVCHSKMNSNTFLLTPQKYAQIIEQVKAAKGKAKKTALDYRRIKRYMVVDTPMGERLYAACKDGQKPQQMFVTTEETYDIIREYHLKFNHGGKNRMLVALKPLYKNITTESLLVYLQLCKPCKNKLIRRGKAPRIKSDDSIKLDDVSSPSIENHFDDDPLETQSHISYEDELEQEGLKFTELYSRGQVDILDVTKDSNEEYKYMMVYRDYINKYVHLKPLKATNVDDSVDALLEIFLVFGAPNILQSKNGTSVVTPICRRISTVCPDIKIVPGKTIFTKDDFKGKSNEDILKLLNQWLTTSRSPKWQQGLKFVQNTLNTTFNEFICRTPSELVFGMNPKKGIASFMSKNECDFIMCEDDLKSALEQKECPRNNSSKQLKLEESLVLPCNFIKMEIENSDDNDSATELN